MSANDPLLICTRGVYSICFPDGYLILTENKQDACAVCTDLGLNQEPYWWHLVKRYDSQEEAVQAANQVLRALGVFGRSLVKVAFQQNRWQVTYYGFMSAL